MAIEQERIDRLFAGLPEKRRYRYLVRGLRPEDFETGQVGYDANPVEEGDPTARLSYAAEDLGGDKIKPHPAPSPAPVIKPPSPPAPLGGTSLKPPGPSQTTQAGGVKPPHIGTTDPPQELVADGGEPEGGEEEPEGTPEEGRDWMGPPGDKPWTNQGLASRGIAVTRDRGNAFDTKWDVGGESYHCWIRRDIDGWEIKHGWLRNGKLVTDSPGGEHTAGDARMIYNNRMRTIMAMVRRKEPNLLWYAVAASRPKLVSTHERSYAPELARMTGYTLRRSQTTHQPVVDAILGPLGIREPVVAWENFVFTRSKDTPVPRDLGMQTYRGQHHMSRHGETVSRYAEEPSKPLGKPSRLPPAGTPKPTIQPPSQTAGGGVPQPSQPLELAPPDKVPATLKPSQTPGAARPSPGVKPGEASSAPNEGGLEERPPIPDDREIPDMGWVGKEAHIYHGLASLPVVGTKVNNSGRTITTRVRFENDLEGMFKPVRGEHFLKLGVPPGSFYRREVGFAAGARVLAGEAGQIVPMTAFRRMGDDVGSIQHFREGMTDALYISDWDRYGTDELASFIATLDYDLGNTDRHRRNWGRKLLSRHGVHVANLLRAWGDLALYDHGLAIPNIKDQNDHSFGSIDFWRYSVRQGLPVSQRLTSDKGRHRLLGQMLRWAGIESDAVDYTLERVRNRASGKYAKIADLPHPGRHDKTIRDLVAFQDRIRNAWAFQREGPVVKGRSAKGRKKGD